jgi:hypothetical protein
MTGYPWNTGDELFAADLNAAIVAASSGVAAGGPFLPLAGNATVTGPTTLSAGGTLTGTFAGSPTWNGSHTFTNQTSAPNITFSGNNTTLSNTNPVGWLRMSGFVGGAVSTVGAPGVVAITVSDKFNSTGVPNAAVGFNYTHNIAPNGNTAVGNRIGMNVALTSIGARQGGSYTYSGINQAAQFTVWGECNVGGTAPAPQGAQTAVGITSVLSYDSGSATGCTYFNGNAGMEIDTCTNAGASTQVENTLLLVHLNGHGSQPAYDDNAIYIGDQVGVTVGRKVALALGSAAAQWPLDPAKGAVVQGRLSSRYTTVPTGAQFGMDMQQVGFPAFNTTARAGFLSSNGFAVDGVGAVQIGTAYATPSATGVAIDCKGIVGTGTPTIAAGGTGYVVGDILFDPWGGMYRVTNHTGGVVTAVAVFTDGNGNPRQPCYPAATPPTNPVATTRWYSGNGAGCTLNLTWNTTATTLSLNPTGKQILTNLAAAATDAAAATAGVSIGGLYNNAGVVHVRLT